MSHNIKDGKNMRPHLYVVIILILFFCASPLLFTIENNEKRKLTIADFDAWRSISGEILSADGSWLSYYLKPQHGDGELIIRNTDSYIEYTIPRGSAPVFGFEDTSVIYTIVPPEDEYGNPGKNIKNKLGIFDIANQDTIVYDLLKRYTLSENKKWLAVLVSDTTTQETEPDTIEVTNTKSGEKPERSVLILRNLITTDEVRIESVEEFSIDEQEHYLIYTVISDDHQVNGIYAKNLENLSIARLHNGIGSYKAITWDEPNERIAFLADGDTTDTKNKPWKIYMWEKGKAGANLLFDPEKTSDFPEEMKIANEPALLWSKKTNSLFFNIQKKAEDEKDTTISAEEIPDVNIWHWRDVLIHPQRETRKQELENKTYTCVYHIRGNSFVQLTDASMDALQLSPDHSSAFGTDRSRYEDKQPWNPEFHDVYIVDLSNGNRKLIRERQRFGLRWSNGSRVLFWFEGSDWYSYELKTGTTHVLSENIPTELRNLVFDRAGVPGSWGLPGWTKDDQHAIIYDRYDIWLVNPDGSIALNLTERQNKNGTATFRYVRLDPDEEFIDLENPLLIRYFDNSTKASGYYRLNHGENRLDSLIVLDKLIGAPKRTQEQNAYLFTIETFDEFPDLYKSDTGFDTITRLTDANPRQEEFYWGSAQLFEWKNTDGVPLQGILYLPAGYEPGKQYPLIVYIYERLADLLHRYSVPRATSRINPAFYTSNGYAVIDADIVYTLGQPGQSAVKSVVPAALKLVEMGVADPDRIGLQGHSWGGYQTAYAITQTNLFSAAVAGTPVSNMISAYGGIRWGTGNPRTYQYEIGQSRIGFSLWERPDLYIENSPVFFADRIQTPLLIMHGDNDGAVPWYQSIELYLAMRRLGKEMFFLHYTDAPHNLRKRKNRIDYNRRIFEFFEHYLRDTEAPGWIQTRASDM